MCTVVYKMPYEPQLPEFSSTVDVPVARPPVEWIKPKEVIERLSNAGVKLSSPTLFNMEKRGELTTWRNTPRNIYFDWGEICLKFKINKECENE